MYRCDTLIVKGKFVTHEGIYENLAVGIKDGKIAYLGDEVHVTADEIIDASGKYVMPGLIEIHNHFGGGSGGLNYDDVVKGETKSAAVGGITTVYHFISETGSVYEKLPHYVEVVNRDASVDVGFHAICMTQQHLDEVKKCREKGITSFKFFLSYKGGEVPGMIGIDYGYLCKGMEAIKEAGGLAMVHAENYELVTHFEDKYRGYPDSFYTKCLSRPNLVEEIDAFASCEMAEKTGCPLYLVHTTSGRTLEIAKYFRDNNNEIYVETTQDYLLINEFGEGLQNPALSLTTPAYKSKKDIDMLWEGLRNGKVQTVSTDSSSILYKDKIGDGTNWGALGGAHTMPTALASLLSEGVHKNRLTLPEIVQLTSYNIAKIFGLYPRKGVLELGSDADIVIVDLDKVDTVEAKKYPACSTSDFSPLEGWEMKGWPIMTLVRGKIVMKDGVTSEQTEGWGQTVNIK